MDSMTKANAIAERQADAAAAFLPLTLRSMFWRPQYLAPSAWTEHVPFAFWLAEAHRPRVFVELGSHWGVSYFGFCQAVDRLGIDTRCFAVDSWEGDNHAGHYDESVFQQVSAYNDAHYSTFSRLVRSSFDEALEHFSDGTIDLLHIDGLHTLEAVTHDFESWLPKLSESAVVLMHDTNVRERGFGVFKLFEALRRRYEVFEFDHGHGLGVVGVGESRTELVSRLFEAERDPPIRRTIHDAFARLGHCCAVEGELVTSRAQTQELTAALEAHKAETQAYRDQLLHLGDEIGKYETLATMRDAEIQRLGDEIGKYETLAIMRDSEIRRLQEELSRGHSRSRIISGLFLYLKSFASYLRSIKILSTKDHL